MAGKKATVNVKFDLAPIQTTSKPLEVSL